MVNSIYDILISLEAEDLIGGFSKWGKSICPYDENHLKKLYYERTDEMSSSLNDLHSRFKKKYELLSEKEKLDLTSWAKDEFLTKYWEIGFGIRPTWTWDNFLSKLNNKNLSYLDVGPCHGVHSNLIYKHYFKGNFQFRSADILVPYLKLQTLCGIDSRYYDADRMDLVELWGKESQDVILFTEVLEHLTEKAGAEVLYQLSSILKKDGNLMITFPVDASPFNNEPFGHLHQPNVENVTKIINKSGINKTSYCKMWSGKTYQHVIIGIKD